MNLTSVLNLILVALVAGVLQGCAALSAVDKGTDAVGEAAGVVAGGYCAATSDAGQAAMRGRLDEHTHPHELRIDCNGQEDE